MKTPFLIDSAAARAAVRLAQGAVAALLPSRVLGGPFRGMRIHKNTFGSALLPKILGTYEAEIAGPLHDAVSDPRTDAFLDVGCAGGFYLQVVSQLRPDIDLIGVDLNARAARIANRDVAKPDRLTVYTKRAEFDDLVRACHRYRRPVILIDIEGGESELLARGAGERIRNAVVIVEIHEYLGVKPPSIARSLEESHMTSFVPFGHYGLRAVGGPMRPLLDLFLRHELRHPCTSYLVATPRQ